MNSGLDEQELAHFIELIARKRPGVYTLRQIYGLAWEGIPEPSSFRRRFKFSLLSGAIRGVEICPEKSYGSAVFTGSAADLRLLEGAVTCCDGAQIKATRQYDSTSPSLTADRGSADGETHDTNREDL